MFATLGGAYPAPPAPMADGQIAADADRTDSLVRAVIDEQAAAGLEPVSDGDVRHPDRLAWLVGALTLADAGGITGTIAGPARPCEGLLSLPTWRSPIAVDAWSFAAECSDLAAKQALIGPYTLGWAVDPGSFSREAITLAFAEALSAEAHALAAAGCPLIQVDEDAAVRIGDSPAERGLFRAAQRRLHAGLDGVHLSLAIRGGNADTAGAATILDAPYRSYLFDLCAGPDNWRLLVEVPADRGVIVGAADARAVEVDGLEILAYAIGYAASTRGRGHDRVGVATSTDMTGLDHAVALAKIRRLGEVAALYLAPAGTLARAIDPRAVDARSAALGRYAPFRKEGAQQRKGHQRTKGPKPR